MFGLERRERSVISGAQETAVSFQRSAVSSDHHNRQASVRREGPADR